HDLLVGLPEAVEVEALRRLDGRDHQAAGAVRARHVDREAEVDVLALQQDGLALLVEVEAVVHVGDLGDRLDHRPADQVGEGDLASAVALEVVVDHQAVVEQQLHRHVAHRGGGGHAERLVHVPGHRGGGAPELDDLRLTQLHRRDLRGGGGDLLRAVRGRGDGGLRGGGGIRGGLGGVGVHGGGVLRGLGGRCGGGLGGGGGVRCAL